MQRTFAAEFLAPIAALKEFLGDDVTDKEHIKKAGMYFGVSHIAVQSQLVNRDVVAREAFFETEVS